MCVWLTVGGINYGYSVNADSTASTVAFTPNSIGRSARGAGAAVATPGIVMVVGLSLIHI